jgi:hypothetical protein
MYVQQGPTQPAPNGWNLNAAIKDDSEEKGDTKQSKVSV